MYRSAKCASLLHMDPTDLLSTSEAAAALGSTVATVNRWAASGKLRVAHKIEGRTGARLFRRSDVEALRVPVDAAS